MLRSFSVPPIDAQLRPHALEAREPFRDSGSSRDYDEALCVNRATSQLNEFSYTSATYPGHEDFGEEDPLYDHAYNVRTLDSCSDGAVAGYVVPDEAVKGVDVSYCTEHIVELQTMQLFFRSIAEGTLPNDDPIGQEPLYCDFVKAAFGPKSENFLPADVPDSSAGFKSRSPIERIMDAHGSFTNWEGFVLLQEEINAAKARVSLELTCFSKHYSYRLRSCGSTQTFAARQTRRRRTTTWPYHLERVKTFDW